MFLLDGYKGRKTTFQVSRVAEKLLQYLDYEPGIRNRNRGPRIPDELHRGLFEIGWVYTNESGISPPTNEVGEIVVEEDGVEITEEIAEDVKSFLQKEGGDDIDELAEILDLDMDGQTEDSSSGFPTPPGASEGENDSSGFPTPSQTPFCDISESRGHEIAKKVAEDMEIEINPDEGSEWAIPYISGGKINQDTGDCQIIIKIEHQSGGNEQFFHKAIFSPKNGLKTVWTITNVKIDWNQRILLERHRKNVLESIISITTEENLDIGDPLSDLKMTTEYDPSIEQFANTI